MEFRPTNPNNTEQSNAEWLSFQLFIDQQTGDFPTIVLTKKERKLLKRSIKNEIKITPNNRSVVDALDRLNLVFRHQGALQNGDSIEVIKIRPRGLYYWKYLRREERFGFIASFRYWVTTAIAAMALIISIVAIVLQAQ